MSKSKLGKGLVVGALFGIAAGIYMASKEGKQLADRLKKQAGEIEKRIRTELKKNKKMSQSAYNDAINTVLAYYVKSKKIAKTELPDLRNYLLGKWDLVKEEIAEVPKEQASKKAKKAKRRK
ncbi:MAG: YtxH domain-containing protein [Patescibacteria group bacterium]